MGCTKNKTPKGITTIELTAESITECDTLVMGAYTIRALSDSTVLLMNSVEPYFSAVNINTGICQSQFGKNGDGPGEYLRTKLFEPVSQHMTTVDPNQQRLYIHDTATFEQLKFSQMTGGIPSNCIVVNDSLFIMSYIGDQIRFAFHNGNITLKDLQTPYPTESKMGAAQASMIYQGFMLKKPHGNQFAYMTYYGNIVEFFKYDSKDLTVDRYAFVNESQPKVDKIFPEDAAAVYANVTKDTLEGYTDGDATDDAIYVLYSGKLTSDPDKHNTDDIEVYDWEGNLIQRYKLDHYILSLCVRGDKLIGLADDGDGYAIITYNLPQ
jgi:hypothetical protein